MGEEEGRCVNTALQLVGGGARDGEGGGGAAVAAGGPGAVGWSGGPGTERTAGEGGDVSSSHMACVVSHTNCASGLGVDAMAMVLLVEV